MTEDMGPWADWTEEEQQLYDARSEHERWDYAWRILRPWLEAAREIGSPELEQVMEEAFGKVEDQIHRTLEVLEPLEAERAKKLKARRGEDATS